MYDHSSFKEGTMNRERMGLWLVVAVLVITAIIIADAQEDRRRAFMKECQMDNLKHYQCVSLWNGGGIPIFRGRDIIPLN
jgi:hypothetical protein